MISFICCSVNSKLAENLSNNIKDTIGNIPFEFIAFDNIELGLGISEVYNRCAERSKYDYLCFLHEDVKFISVNWGKEIVEKMSEDDCGAIGFAGSVIKLAYPSGWFINQKNTRTHYRQIYKKRHKHTSYKKINPDRVAYSEVVTLDGMALFVSKRAWSECKFDSDMLRGFHCYDIDFTMNLRCSGYKNYVTNRLLLEHFSEGSFSEQWRLECLKTHAKWVEHLPLYATSLSEKYLKKRLPKAFYSSIKVILKHDLYVGMDSSAILNHIKRYPCEFSSLKLIKYYKDYKKRYES